MEDIGIFSRGFPTERQANDFLQGVFRRNDFLYHAEYPTGAGRIDFVLHDQQQQPLLGIECKKALLGSGNLATFTDAFEQCVAYANALHIPVLLAPILVSDCSPSVIGLGGRRVDAYKAISIFAGRVNVGGMFFDMRGSWTMMLRGVAVAAQSRHASTCTFRPEALRFVLSTNSKKLRSA